MSSQEGFEVGEIVKLVGISGLEGIKVTVVRNLAKDRWAVAMEGEEKKSKIVSSKNLEKLGSSSVPPKPYSIVGTWDEWESHEMTWDGTSGCYEYPVLIGNTGTESFKMLLGADWDACVYPDRNHANPYEEHEIIGPDGGGFEAEWTIGQRREDGAREGDRFQVQFYVYPDGRPKCVKWEAPSHPGGRQETVLSGNAATHRAAEAQSQSMSRPTVKDILKKVPGQATSREEETPATAKTSPDAKRSSLPRTLGGRQAPAGHSEPEPSAAPQNTPATASNGPVAAAPAAAEIPAEKVSKPLSTVLREVRQQSTPKELAMTKTKMMQAGIKSTEDLVQALRTGRLQESLQGDTLPEGLVEALADFFGLQPQQCVQPQAAAAKTPLNVWEVVGGAETGGLVVRGGREKTSEALEERIPFGALVEEIEIADGRLHYKKRKGGGPPEGWILMELKGKELVKRATDVEQEVPKQSAPRAAASTQDVPRPSNRVAPRPAEPTRQPHQDLPAELREQAKRLEVPLEKLHDQSTENVADLLERVGRAQRSTASKLQVQYADMGFPIDVDDMVERAEMMRRVNEVLIWQELALTPLQEVCAKKGFEVLMEQPREELLQLLTNFEWEQVGIPITRIADLEAARGVFCQMRALESAGPNKLVSECKRMGLPTSASAATMTSQLKQALIWKALPSQELLRECKAHGLQPTVGDLSAESTRQELYQDLVNCMWANRCEARGIPAKRLGSMQLADELLEKVDRLQVMGPLSLQMEYRKMGITYDSKLDMQALVDRLRDMLVWEALPLGELQEECRQQGLPHTDGRKAMLQRLRKRLDDELELEAQGLPVRRLGGYEAAMELMEQHETIEQMSMEDLMEWYKGTGFPEEKGTTKDELMQLLKALAVWEALPLTELTQDCAKHKVVVKDVRQIGTEAQQREFLVTSLLQQQRLKVWEEQGFKAQKIGFEGACQVVKRYSQLDSMSNEDLERSYAERGLPKEPDMDRAAVLETLKRVLVWEALPLFELQMDCLERSDKIQCDFESTGTENEQRASLVRQLTVETLRSAYESIGVPVERIGYLEAHAVGRELVGYTIMGEQELQSECQKLGISANPEMTCAELITRLRQYVLWDVLPAAQLQHRIGITSESKLSPMPEEGKKVIVFLCSSLTGHKLPMLRLIRWFVDTKEWEVHAGAAPDMIPELPEGVVAHPELSSVAFMEAGKNVFKEVALHSHDWGSSFAKMITSVVETPVSDYTIVLGGLKAFMEKTRTAVVVSDSMWSGANHLHTLCRLYDVPLAVLLCPGRPDAATSVLKVLWLVCRYAGFKQLFAVMARLDELKALVKPISGDPLPDSDKPIMLLPGSDAILDVKPAKNELICGPFLPLNASKDANGSFQSPTSLTGATDPGLREWLMAEPGKPIVYVAFGSLVKPSKDLVSRVVEALHRSPWRILWVVDEAVRAHLPPAAEVSDSQWRLETWVQQYEVLSFSGVRCFVSHCGANSSLEAMSLGVPVVGIPFYADQYEWASAISNFAGAGIILDKLKSDAAEVRNAVQQVVEQPNYSVAAWDVAQRMRVEAKEKLAGIANTTGAAELPGVVVAGNLIEQMSRGEDPTRYFNRVPAQNHCFGACLG